ncbi:transcriptional regulator [Paracidovorax wautersii]|uniref:helix-turn-helix domain-containing protein n=1 Tax=Paracidovorax wautersii TaxID=1177982 RepID=UPI0031E46EC1
MNQSDFGAAVGASRKTQFNYESDERRPDADYLAAVAQLGGDVIYILTGDRAAATPAAALSAEEKVLLEYFKAATKDVKRAVMGALVGATQPVPAAVGAVKQKNKGTGAVQVGYAGGKVTVSKGR